MEEHIALRYQSAVNDRTSLAKNQELILYNGGLE